MANIMIYIAGFGACGELLPSALLLVALLTGLVGCVLLADRVSGRLLASAASAPCVGRVGSLRRPRSVVRIIHLIASFGEYLVQSSFNITRLTLIDPIVKL